MTKILRPGFRVPPIHKPPAVEAILGQVVGLLQVQSLQVQALIKCVGQEKFDAMLNEMATNPPEEVTTPEATG